VDKDRQQALKESIHLYEGVIRSFEAARARMEERRKGAIDSVMVHIDESLALNERTLASLHQILAAAQEQLQEERLRTKAAQ
jgi:hypothetical protein